MLREAKEINPSLNSHELSQNRSEAKIKYKPNIMDKKSIILCF
jgi:hypothetical protein